MTQELNPVQDRTPHIYLLNYYVNMTQQTGKIFETNPAEEHTYLVKFTSGNSTAESKI